MIKLKNKKGGVGSVIVGIIFIIFIVFLLVYLYHATYYNCKDVPKVKCDYEFCMFDNMESEDNLIKLEGCILKHEYMNTWRGTMSEQPYIKTGVNYNVKHIHKII